ncbi:hypothetical protein V5N11_014674 [Cardamine amara subsp. amara]|uniref:RNase H type-1 domain-containing protein n=1 Tax=Cardamine amara subsp. amara TaxID=228776 RepID=A0ABD0ZFQ4_CARAN
MALKETELWLKQQENETTDIRLAQAGPQGLGKRWVMPAFGVVKCNFFSSRCNATSICGGGWLLRDHSGEVVFHAREAFMPVACRLAAELLCLYWVLRSLIDLQVGSCEIWMESAAAVDAIENSGKWPRL